MTAPRKQVFVFGSNLHGIHGRGSALKAATFHGAERGVGIGPTGQSYAIPTKDTPRQTLPIIRIKVYVDRFIRYAKAHPEIDFMLVNIGTGNAGYAHQDMALLFKKAPDNVKMSETWNNILNRRKL